MQVACGAPLRLDIVVNALGFRLRNPERASVAPENSAFDETILQLLYGKGNRGTYRILFTILDQKVFVLHVRHGSMLPLQPKN